MTKLNCDMGESFGIYQAGNDDEIMPLIDVANVACGFHASDPNHMRKTVELAKKNNVKVGAHPSFPDLQGFGRREMKMSKLELKNNIMYQVGALKAFLDEMEMPLNHIKPHGALYVMASKDEEIARAIADAVAPFNVGIFGMAHTVHEKVYKHERGLNFIAEFYADLDYDETGKLVLAKGKNSLYDSDIAAERTLKAIREMNEKYIGFLYAGLMVKNNEPYLIEYNVRMGDPESEVVLPRIKSDLLELLYAAGNGNLKDHNIIIDDKKAATVFLVSGGYPEQYEKNKEIFGLDSVIDSLVFHAGAKYEDGKVKTNGGRVIAITSIGNSVKEALEKSYKSIKKINFEKMNYRKDIGFDL